MKYLIFALLIIVLTCGCSSKAEVVVDGGIHKLRTYGNDYEIREFEYKGCEYLVVGQGSGQTITHKGNCKYCLERNK